MSDCPFCKIARGEAPAEIVHEEEAVVAFRYLDPKAPVHVLVIPQEHATEVTDPAPATVEELFGATQEVAKKPGIAERGYAVRINNGEDAGQ